MILIFPGEGEYIMPTSTVFGLSEAEKVALKSDGLEVTSFLMLMMNDDQL